MNNGSELAIKNEITEVAPEEINAEENIKDGTELVQKLMDASINVAPDDTVVPGRV